MPLDTLPLVKRRTVLLAALQATNGTAETLVAATHGAILAYNASFSIEGEMDEREMPGGGQMAPVEGPRSATLTFSVDIAGAGGAVGADYWTTLLKACGMVNTLGVWSFASLAATTTTQQIATIGCYVDGIVRVIRDAQGSVKFTLAAGRKTTAEFTFKGVWVASADAALPAPDYSNIPAPPRFAQSGALEVDGVAFCASQVEIAIGNDVQLRECPNDASGYRSAVIVDRKPTITIDPEATKMATYNWEAKRSAATLLPFTAAVGSVANNTITFDSTKLAVRELGFGDRNGIVTNDVTLMVVEEDFTITFS